MVDEDAIRESNRLTRDIEFATGAGLADEARMPDVDARQKSREVDDFANFIQ